MKEALFYKKLKNNKVQCLLCPHNCIILENKFGFCNVRKNIEGKLYSLVYAKPVSMHLDPIEKKPLYHFHPGSQIFSIGTFGCNLSCLFCQNYDISQAKDIKNFEEIVEKLPLVKPEEIIYICKEKGYKFVAFTYNEPTVFYEYMIETAKLCRKNSIKTVMVSNGQINEKPLKALIRYIDAFNIDLKGNEQFYKRLCSGDFKTTINAIKLIAKAKKHIEITFLLIEKENDNEKEFDKTCKFISSIGKYIPLHISRAFPYYKMSFQPTPIELMKKFEKIAKKHLKNVYLGNV